MTTRELLHAEIDHLDDQGVDEVYQLVRRYTSTHEAPRSGCLLSKLKEIKIDGPPDFSTNLDYYLYGDLGAREEDVH